MARRLSLADLDRRIEALKQELELLDHAYQQVFATGSHRQIRAVEQARQVSLRDASRAIRQRQKLTAGQAEVC